MNAGETERVKLERRTRRAHGVNLIIGLRAREHDYTVSGEVSRWVPPLAGRTPTSGKHHGPLSGGWMEVVEDRFRAMRRRFVEDRRKERDAPEGNGGWPRRRENPTIYMTAVCLGRLIMRQKGVVVIKGSVDSVHGGVGTLRHISQSFPRTVSHARSPRYVYTEPPCTDENIRIGISEFLQPP